MTFKVNNYPGYAEEVSKYLKLALNAKDWGVADLLRLELTRLVLTERAEQISN